MELSAIEFSSEEEIIFEGEGESTNVVGSVGRLVKSNCNPVLLSHMIHNSDTSSESYDEMEQRSEEDLDNYGIDAVRCPKPIRCSSPIHGFFNSQSSMLEFSKRSDPSGFEGQGGDISVLDPTALQNEVAELKFQNRKLLEDISQVNKQITAADDAQFNLLTQNEEMAKQIVQLKENSDKFKLMSKELEETKINLARHEDKNTILTTRIRRLEKDNAELVQNADELKEELDTMGVEIEKYRVRFKESEEEKESVKMLSVQRINFLETSIADYTEKFQIAETTISELSKIVEQLRIEKHELEISFADSPSQLVNVDKKLRCLDDTACTDDLLTEEDDENLISFRASSCTAAHNSIHSEIAASLGRSEMSSLPEFRHDSLIRHETSECSSPWDMASTSDFTHRMRCILYEILEELQNARSEYFLNSSEKGKKEVEDVIPATVDGLPVKTSDGSSRNGPSRNGPSCNGPETVAQVEQVVSVVAAAQSPETSPKDEDVVRRIHEELTEFRLQLKKSQELFHAFSSGQSFSVTKSCPLLADDNDSEASVLKPQYVTCSTQTDMAVIPSSSRSGLSMERPEQSDEVLFGKLSLDDNMLDKLSLDDEDSYNLTINLPTVLEEESEAETETSPASLSRRMSSERRNRLALCRMANTTDEAVKSDDEGAKSEADFFYSAQSSLRSSKIPSTLNSLGRPLQVSSGANFQSADENPDGASVVSDDHTTFGSPLSSSSPIYLTPSQGSSSQETITNLDGDGDKTPVNGDESRFREGAISCPPDSKDSNSLRKRSSPIEKLALPIDDYLSESFAKGVIHESDKAHMTRFAYDAVMRSIDKDADILKRSEWRTLKRDLDAQELLQYNKGFAQEEGGDGDTLDGGPMPSGDALDLDDEAEEYAFETGFPAVVENLFRSLDKLKLKGRDVTLSTEELEAINTRFDKLSNVFKTDHIELPKRAKECTREFENAQTRIQEIIGSLKSSLVKLRKAPNSSELQDVLRHMEHNSQELQIRSNELSAKAKRVGSIDLQARVYKMIEVMVLYVHILQNYESPAQKFTLVKTTQLCDNKVESPMKTSNVETWKSNNHNNNNEKVSWTGGYLGERQRMESCRQMIEEGSEFLRRELSWPWNWEQTWKGVKQCFSIILMVVGLVIIFRSVFPIASDDSNSCGQPTNVVFSALTSHSSLIHEKPPDL